MPRKIAAIIGAGPAGLTAAYELQKTNDVKPVIYEMTGDIGGISKTVVHKGNRIDIGGHRFFSKSDWVMRWWQDILPVQGKPARDDKRLGRRVTLSRDAQAPDPEETDGVMLVRNRLSRIFFLGKFFDYPITLSFNALINLGLVRVLKIGFSYVRARCLPIKTERSLEDFFINRFGRELYATFFRDYTQKVWGVPCSRIKPEWGAQRIKGFSMSKAVWHALRSLIAKDATVNQASTETTLIGLFLYPKLGPGQLWDEVARRIRERGGEIHFRQRVVGLEHTDSAITAMVIEDTRTGDRRAVTGDYFISTMPVDELIRGLNGKVPPDVRRVAAGLSFRDFITVGVLLKKLKLKNKTKIKTLNDLIPDNWIYIQERDVKLGRLQIFNNWSPYMAANENTVWLGLEYFCNQGDELWSKSDEEFSRFAIDELAQIELIDKADVLDSVVIRMPKTYPGYFGTYDEMPVIHDFVGRFENLFLIGRNGMHRYNNQAHSMLTARTAVENIRRGITSKDNIWALNIEEDTFAKKLTAMENLTEGMLKEPSEESFDYHPDRYWRSAGASYAAFPSVRHRRRFIVSALKQHRPTADSFIFDYGCGMGDVLEEVQRRYGLGDEQLGGCDISEEALSAARRKINTPFLYNELFPNLPKPCDVIICTEIIEHTEQYQRILSWIHDNLVPGGLVILTTQSGALHKSDLYAGHTQHFKIKQLNRLLEESDFAIRTSSLWGFPLFTIQKHLTDISFGSVRRGYVEGDLTFRRRLVFNLAYVMFRLGDGIHFGPQIYITATRSA